MRERKRIAEENAKQMNDLRNEVNDKFSKIYTAITPQKQPPSRRLTGVSIVATDTVSVDQTAITESTAYSAVERNVADDHRKEIEKENKLLLQQLRSTQTELRQEQDKNRTLTSHNDRSREKAIFQTDSATSHRDAAKVRRQACSKDYQG